MKIYITAKTKSKNPGIQKTDDHHYIVAVRQSPKDGQANIAIMEALADYLKIGISQVILIKGFSTKQKVFEIE